MLNGYKTIMCLNIKGVFSVPSYHSEWFWWDWQGSSPAKDVVDFMNKNYPPVFYFHLNRFFKSILLNL